MCRRPSAAEHHHRQQQTTACLFLCGGIFVVTPRLCFGDFLFGFLFFSLIRISLLHLFVSLSLSRQWGLCPYCLLHDTLRQPALGCVRGLDHDRP
jgi:hypothetical protein